MAVHFYHTAIGKNSDVSSHIHPYFNDLNAMFNGGWNWLYRSWKRTVFKLDNLLQTWWTSSLRLFDRHTHSIPSLNQLQSWRPQQSLYVNDTSSFASILTLHASNQPTTSTFMAHHKHSTTSWTLQLRQILTTKPCTLWTQTANPFTYRAENQASQFSPSSLA